MKRIVCLIGFLIASGCILNAAEIPKVNMPAGYKAIGNIQHRSSQEIKASNWSIGAETMCRDYTVYRHWREYLGPLGAKSARIQSGWAKTEKVKGKYDWAWLDEIIPDMLAQGVKPWVCLCYGNPIYPGGGTAAVNSRPPDSKEALQGWDRFVHAFVDRYDEFIDEWEIWNEPLYQNITMQTYADFYVRTAKVIRAVQPTAKLFGVASAGVDVDSTEVFLRILHKDNNLDFINSVTYHPYWANPDDAYPPVAALRKVVNSFSPDISLFQGESGAPSTNVTYGALSGHAWTELTQAKWLSRRLLGDLGRDIRSSYFSIADMHYPGNGGTHMNTKGLLATYPDKTVERTKIGYGVYQNITALFDNTLKRVQAPPADDYSLFAYTKQGGFNDGKCVYTLWRHQAMPSGSMHMPVVRLQLPAEGLDTPVLVDMLSGVVYKIDASLIERSGDDLVLTRVPVGDWPVVIADALLIKVE